MTRWWIESVKRWLESFREPPAPFLHVFKQDALDEVMMFPSDAGHVLSDACWCHPVRDDNWRTIEHNKHADKVG